MKGGRSLARSGALPFLEWTQTILVVVFLLGSALHIGSEAVSGTNLIAACMLPWLLFSIYQERLSAIRMVACFGFLALFLAALIAMMMSPVYENVRLVWLIYVAGMATFGAAQLAARHPRVIERSVIGALAVSFVVALAQVSFVLRGVGLDPSNESIQLGDGIDGLTIGFRSIFNNPNDFSVFACLVLLLFLFRRGLAARAVALASLACVVISGSKMAILIALMATIFILARRVLWLMFPLVLLVALAVVQYSDQLTGIYALDRLMISIREVVEGDVAAGSSVDVRVRSHVYFISHYPSFLVGSFDASTPFPQFGAASFDVSLIAENPHSLVIELHALFGVLGLLALLCMGYALWAALSRHVMRLSDRVFLFLAVAALTTVPSSVLAFSALFGLITAIATVPATAAASRTAAGRAASHAYKEGNRAYPTVRRTEVI